MSAVAKTTRWRRIRPHAIGHLPDDAFGVGATNLAGSLGVRMPRYFD